jgi:predicted MFS family arabinose efflux permease
VAGQTVSVFTIFYAICAPIFGALTANKSARWVLMSALSVFARANAVSALATSFTLLLVARAVAGMAAGLYTPTAASAAAATVSEKLRGRALGMIMGGLAMGTAVGVPFGLMMAQTSGWRAAMWLIAGLEGFAFAGVGLRFRDVHISTPPSLRQRFAILGDRQVMSTAAVSFITAVGSIGLYTYIAALLTADGHVDNVLPYLWAWSVGGLAGIYLAGVLLDRLGRAEWIMAAMLATMVVIFGALLEAGQYPALAIVSFFVWGASAWGAQTPQQHRMLSLQPKHGSTAVGLHSSAHYLGSAVGAALGGAIIAVGFPVPYMPLVAAGTLFAALMWQIILAVQTPRLQGN